MFVIKRDTDQAYVSDPRCSSRSYTKDLRQAKRYATIADVEKELCENEHWEYLELQFHSPCKR